MDMKKGQLALDFLITIVLLLVFLQLVVSFSENFLYNQEKTAIKLQAKSIVSEIDKTIKYAYAQEQSLDYSIRFDIPRIQIGSPPGSGQPALIDCDIDITSTDITLTVNNTHYPQLSLSDTIVETVPRILGTQSFANIHCGDTIVLEDTSVCGDGVIGGPEQCDGANLGSATCDDVYGFSAGGNLSCIPTGSPYQCTFDTTACTGRPDICAGACRATCLGGEVQNYNGVVECTGANICCVATGCGNGVYEPATEQCDDENTVNGDGCSDICTVEPTWACPGGYFCHRTS